MTLIYGLRDPRSGECRYVGKTDKDLKTRLRRHINRAATYPGSTRCASWIAALRSDGMRPEIFLLEEVAEGWPEAEQFWIAYLRFLGAELTNLTDGGATTHGHRHTADTRRRLSELSRQQFKDADRREAAAQYAKAAWADPAYRARHAATRNARGVNQKASAQQRALKLKLWQDPEYRVRAITAQRSADHSSGAKKMWERPEYRAAQAAARARRKAQEAA